MDEEESGWDYGYRQIEVDLGEYWNFYEPDLKGEFVYNIDRKGNFFL